MSGDSLRFENDPPPSASSITLGGNVTGPGNANTVVKIQDYPVSSAAPSMGDVLTWDGTQWKPSATSATLETAGSALAIGVSVQRSGSDRMLAEDGTYAALRDAFAGFTTSAAAANGNPVAVAGNGARATGLTSITIGSGYYVSTGVLIPESGLAAFIAGAVSGTWYRFVGTGDSTTSIKQAWGEPQQVP